MSSVRNRISYPFRIIRAVLLLPRKLSIINQQQALSAEQIEILSKHSAEITKGLDTNLEKMHSLDNRIVSLQQTLDQYQNSHHSPSEQVVNNTVSDNHSLDHFYKLFEDRFRGSEEVIKERVSEHIPLFTTLPKPIKGFPVVDIGCGRGEFLSVLKDSGLNAIGVDMNKSMVERANKLGYVAFEDDALSYLKKQKSNSLAAVTGFHIVEHIPFESLIAVFREAYRSIAPGGFVLFETPNPNNVSVGSSNFYMDPSHIKPIPPDLLAFSLEYVGFKSEILPLHPVKENLHHSNKTIEDMMNMFYGPRDYAVLARKL